MSEEFDTESGGDTAEDSGEVLLTELSDSELEEHIEAAQEVEPEPVESDEEQSTDETSEEEIEAAQEPEEQPEEQKQEPEPEQPAKDPRVALQRTIEQQQQQIAQLTHHAQRQRSEIGRLRQQREQRIEQLQQGLEDKHTLDPNGWYRDQQEIANLQQEVDTLDAQDEGVQARLQTQHTIASFLTPEEANMENMVACLQRDPRVSPDYVEQVKRDPMGAMTGDTFIHLAKRAQAEQAVVGLYSMVKELEKERDELKAKMSESSKRPSNLLKKIDEIAKSKPTISSQNGSAAKSKSPNINITDLSDTELEEALARAS